MLNKMLTETNYILSINSFSNEDWESLLALIPEIENTTQFAEAVAGTCNNNGFLTVPYNVPSAVVNRFCEIVYDLPIIIDFNWSAWIEGREMLKDRSFDFDSIDIPEKCKLITIIIRSDRFCDGALISAFREGIILEILKSIKRQLGLR